jgi:hypothetical protein
MIKEKLLGLLHVYLMCVGGLFVIVLAFALLGRQVHMHYGGAFPMVAGPIFFLVGALILLFIFTWIGIGVAVYYDAKRRGMEPLLWALVATLIPYLLGLIAYLIVRHPVQSLCASCSQPYTPNDVYCKHCGTAVQAQCPSCGRPATSAARFCPQCGARMGDTAAAQGKSVVI